jgi:hypothetical protein
MVFLRAKVIVIGDSCVGKSAICQVLGSDGGMYPKNYTSVIHFKFNFSIKKSFRIWFLILNLRL